MALSSSTTTLAVARDRAIATIREEKRPERD
jgi:hypothetical protein